MLKISENYHLHCFVGTTPFLVELFWDRDKFILLMSISPAVSAMGDECLDDSLDLIRSLAMALLCLNLNDSLPVSMIWQ